MNRLVEWGFMLARPGVRPGLLLAEAAGIRGLSFPRCPGLASSHLWVSLDTVS